MTRWLQIGHDPSASAFVEAARPTTATCRIVDIGSLPASLADLESEYDRLQPPVIVLAGPPALRAELLRWITRQAPVDVVTAVPLAERPDVYHEFSLFQKEHQLRVLPLLPELGHPLLARLQELLPTLSARVISAQWTLPLAPDVTGAARFADGWHSLRQLVGEFSEVQTVSAPAGDMLQATLRSPTGLHSIRWQIGSRCSLRLDLSIGGFVQAELAAGWSGVTQLRWESAGVTGAEMLPASPVGQRWAAEWRQLDAERATWLWTEATRQAELAEAVAYSMAKGRKVDLAYPEFSEEASFKSIMTAAGCGLIWLTILLAILAAAGVPGVKLVLLPLLVGFLLLQSLWWIFPRRPAQSSRTKDSA